MTDTHDAAAGEPPASMKGAETSGNPVEWVAADETDAQAMLDRVWEIAQTRAATHGVPVPDPDRPVILRDPRFAIEESCPACGTYPRWADGEGFGCYACSATSTTPVGRLLPMTTAQLRVATRLVMAEQRVDISAALLAAEQVLAGTLRLRSGPRDQQVASIRGEAEVHVWRIGPATVVVLIQARTGAVEDQAPQWATEHVVITRYDLAGPEPVRAISGSATTAPGVPQAAGADLAEFHRTLAAATTTWVSAVPELRGLDAPQLPAQHGWHEPRKPS